MMMVDDVVIVAWSEDGRHRPFLQKAPQFPRAIRNAVDPLALGFNGPHANGHLRGANPGK